MNIKNSELKKRLAALQINKPLRFSKPGVNTKEKGECQNEVAQFEGACDESFHKELPQTELPAIEIPHTQVAQSEEAPKRRAHSKLPQSETPQKEKCNDGNTGYFKLSHNIFSHSMLRELSGDCFRLFLWLSSRAWRFPDSDGTVRASIGYMETHLGMGHATVSRGLKALKDAQLIQLVEVNFKTGNLWQISPVAVGGGAPENSPPRPKVPQQEVPKNSADGDSKRGGGSLILRERVPRNERQIININKTKNSEECAGGNAQFEAAVTAFESSLSEETRHAITAEFAAREFPHGIFPPAKVIRNLVALEWHSQIRSAERAQAV